jgi:carboxyl-terminal processing protease
MGRGRAIYASGSCLKHFVASPEDWPVRLGLQTGESSFCESQALCLFPATARPAHLLRISFSHPSLQNQGAAFTVKPVLKVGMKKRIVYSVFLMALGVNLVLGARLYITSVKAEGRGDVYENIKLLSSVLYTVRKDYVDADKTTDQDLIYGALKGMLATLDPHSEFMEPSKFDELKKDTEGAFGGVGIVIGLRDSFLTVIAPMEDTPAFTAGVMTGDRIVRIDGKSTEKFSLPDAVKKLRGEPGTDVAITVLRPSSGMVKDYKFTRAIIKVDTVKDINSKKEFPLGDSRIGYIRLSQFNEPTGDELESALKKLEGQGMQGLVLDLRDNPGGLLDQAVKVCGKFLPRNTLVVTTEGRRPPRMEYTVKDTNKHPKFPMVVLVNIGSASASEIVAGCLQDEQRAVIVGEQTFGKGSVQSILPLEDGSALRLTTAKYYTPSHKVIHEKGITPDIVVPVSREEAEALAVKRIPGGLESLENIDEKGREFVKNVRDAQLDRAMDLLKGILLFTQHPKQIAKVTAK